MNRKPGIPDRRGNSKDRRRRHQWLVDNFRADVSLVASFKTVNGVKTEVEFKPACRCYRCGELLTVDTVTADRIVPGWQGGTYRRDNIRPACSRCQSKTGGSMAQLAKAKRKVARALSP